MGNLRIAEPSAAPDIPPPDIPIAKTPAQAYEVGVEAARRGDDLHVVFHAGLRVWPLDLGLDGLAELLACAARGYFVEDARG